MLIISNFDIILTYIASRCLHCLHCLVLKFETIQLKHSTAFLFTFCSLKFMFTTNYFIF